jgi:hypothetical protein
MRFTLLTDGSSDRVLIPILSWFLGRRDTYKYYITELRRAELVLVAAQGRDSDFTVGGPVQCTPSCAEVENPRRRRPNC